MSLQNTQSNDIRKLKEVVDFYLKRWKIFLISLIVCVGIAILYIFITKPVYQITANILVAEKETSPMSQMQSMVKGFSLSDIVGGSTSIHNEMELIRSFSMFRRVVKDLQLNEEYSTASWLFSTPYYTNSPVTVMPLNDIADTLNTTLKFKIQGSCKSVKVKMSKGFKKIHEQTSSLPFILKTSYGDFRIDTTRYYNPQKEISVKVSITGYDYAAEMLQKKVEVDMATKKADIINMQMKEMNIKKGKDILNELIASYNTSDKERRNVLAGSMELFLDERIRVISKELVEIEKEVEAYKKENSLTDIEAEAKIILDKSTDFKERLIEAETQYTVIELVEQFLLKPENRFSLVPLNIGLSDRTVLEGLQKYNEALLERLKLLKTTQGNTPTLDIMNEQIDAMHDNMLATIRSLKSGFSHAKENLQEQGDYFMARIKGMPTQEREFVNIKRQQMIKQELFVFLLQKKEENALSMAVTTPKAEIVDKAYSLSKPVSPRPLKLLAFAMGIAIIGAGCYVKVKY
ncbi:GumC family protein [Bacteroides intestinalis]|jgi:uncharacterized protein involved in exopolysaccharide biosynthesis|uniref:GumC family protein n=1 Tax=Bacteroides intestinalis TaxID=329854 RepID=UPI0022E0D4F4|nr:Wzz/FepE/Etk N-terminal domain-containing protein [Bacteroides intestinalis]